MSVPRGGGWGNLPGAEPARTLARDWRFEPLPAGGPLLAVGMQRSYGDVCANGGGTVLSTRWLDRLVAFDAATDWARLGTKRHRGDSHEISPLDYLEGATQESAA